MRIVNARTADVGELLLELFLPGSRQLVQFDAQFAYLALDLA